MSNHRKPFSKAAAWTVEPKAPSVISLSIRDQNILRPPKRSSSLKSAARGLKHGLSSHHLSPSTVKENIQARHRDKYNSCSSLRVEKTRTPATKSSINSLNCSVQSPLRHSQSTRASNLALSDLLELDLEELPRTAHRAHGQPGHDLECATNPTASTETVVHRRLHCDRRPSSSLSSNTVHHKFRDRQSSAKSLISKMMESVHKRRHHAAIDYLVEDKSFRFEQNTSVASESSSTNATSDERPASANGHLSSLSMHDQAGLSINHGIAVHDELLPRSLHVGESQCDSFLPQLRDPSWASSALEDEDVNSGGLRLPLRIHVTIRADIQEATVTTTDSIWTVVQIHAELPRIPLNQRPKICTIAVAMVLDNSRLATRKDVKKACLEVMTLAATFEPNIDQIGVYCTSGANLADTCLLPLSPLNLEILQAKLEEVSNRPRNSYRVEDALLQAAQALRTLQMQSHRSTPQIKHDIVILTSSAMGLSSCLQQDLHDFRVHIVNPSLIPYSSKISRQLLMLRGAQLKERSDAVETSRGLEDSLGAMSSGWLLDASRCIADDCDAHGSHCLVDALEHSRIRAYAGAITNVNVTVQERKDGVIEDIAGDLAYPVLLPGQIVSIPIQIRLSSLASRFSISSDADYRSSSRMSMADAISELEFSLGNHLSELYEIQISYNHSFFPGNTRLEVRESCWLPRSLPPQMSNHFHEDEQWRSVQLYADSRVQKQLALCLAASSAPDRALQRLSTFGKELLSEGAANFLDALMRRLRHRAALFSDASFMDYLQTSEHIEPQLPRYEDDEEYELYLDDFINAHGTHGEMYPYQPTTIIRKRPRHITTSTEARGEEEARRIWQHIRRTSRPGEPPRPETTDVAGIESVHHDPHMEALRTTALKHGRKISTATLRSLAKEFRLDANMIEEEQEEHDSELD